MRSLPVTLLLPATLALVSWTQIPSIAHAQLKPDAQIQFLNTRMKREGATKVLLFARARLHLKTEHWKAAHRDLKRVLRKEPDNVHAEIALGEAELRLGRYGAARRTLQSAMKRRPASERATLLLAEVFRAQHKYAKAASIMESLIAQADQPSSDLYLEQAELLEQAGKEPEAEAAIDLGIEKHGPLAALLARGLSLRGKAPKKVSYEWLAKHQDSSEMTPGLRLDFAELATHLGNHDQANEQIKQVLKHLSALPGGRRNADAILGLQARIEELTRVLRGER